MELHVVADDRTGALETAAAVADRLGAPVAVAVWPDAVPPRQQVAVIDLGSRHLAPAEAAERAASLPVAGLLAHKIDSTLRGNWAVELAARQHASGRAVLLVPALPALGRTCVGGVVLEHGRPVHTASAGGDAVRRIESSRPAQHLLAAGVEGVEALAGLDAVSAWLAAPVGVAVADAGVGSQVEQIVAAWRGSPAPILAGTSAVVAAAIPAGGRRGASPAWGGLALVVCGSANPVARRQIARLAERGVDGREVAVLTTPLLTRSVSHASAQAAARSLAEQAAARWNEQPVDLVVVIGGDTAAAVLGDSLMVVSGTAGPGTAVVESIVVDVPVITRAGGFGDDDALVDLLNGTLQA